MLMKKQAAKKLKAILSEILETEKNLKEGTF